VLNRLCEMAKQCGVNLFVGTRFGCTGYILNGKPYIRRRSSLDRDQWGKSAAFARTRAASVVFGGASAFASQIWQGVPAKMKKLMDAGAYNRLVVAVQQTHLESAATYVHRAARGKVAAHAALSLDAFEGRHLGRALNGMDLSEGKLLASGVQLGAGDQGRDSLSQRLSPECEAKFQGNFDLGEFFHLERAEAVSVHGLAELARFVPDGAAVRVRLHVARVEALPHRWCATAKRYLRDRDSRAEKAAATSGWVVLGARGSVRGDRDSVSVAFPGRIVAAGDEDRSFLNFVALEVGVQQANGRWRRLDAACKAFVVCSMQGGEVPTPVEAEAGLGIGCGVMPTCATGMGAGIGCGITDLIVGTNGALRGRDCRYGDSIGIGCEASCPYGDGVFELDVGVET
jgi:hypothetical protein